METGRECQLGKVLDFFIQSFSDHNIVCTKVKLHSRLAPNRPMCTTTNRRQVRQMLAEIRCRVSQASKRHNLFRPPNNPTSSSTHLSWLKPSPELYSRQQRQSYHAPSTTAPSHTGIVSVCGNLSRPQNSMEREGGCATHHAS